jgi:hypothetical protein
MEACLTAAFSCPVGLGVFLPYLKIHRPEQLARVATQLAARGMRTVRHQLCLGNLPRLFFLGQNAEMCFLV